MLTDAQRRRRLGMVRAQAGFLPIKKLACTRCGVVMHDNEPMAQRQGQFDHPTNGCPNAGLSFVEWPDEAGHQSQKARGIVPVASKKYQRQKRRSARFASKHRPR